VHPPCSLYWFDEFKNYDVGLSFNGKRFVIILAQISQDFKNYNGEYLQKL
jgi:hypothetical protein